jgi:signal transduction histidine kinase/ActR/RegA family two-component response regulator
MLVFARRTLLWKYAGYFAGLVSLLLAISGIVSGYFAYRESIAALEEVQQATARYAAKEIANFMRSVQQALRGSLEKFDTGAGVDPDDLRIELVALMRHHREVSEVRWIGARGEEQFLLSHVGLNSSMSGRSLAEDPGFVGAHRTRDYVGKVHFLKESEPYVSVSVARSSTSSVLEAEVNLKYIWDLIAQAHLKPGGVAFVVDSEGQLVSHPNIDLVLAKTDLSSLPHVRRALDRNPQAVVFVGEGTDVVGRPVVSTAVPIPNLGWTVFAEQSVSEAFRPVYASMARSAVLVALGIAAAIAMSVVLARRMVRPIREVESRARLLGEGDFSQRIDLRTGDELEAMATQFNRMAAHLQDMHQTQELRIAERTNELALANEAKTRFLAAASHDLRQPLHALALFVGQLRTSELSGDAADLSERIERSVEALATLLEALLDLSKLDVASVTATPECLPLQDMLRRLTAQAAPSAEAKGLAITLVRTSLWVRSDPILLERILQNLLSNAVRYTERGRILVGCRRRGENVEVMVADTGVGIGPEHLPYVFEEFYRAPRQNRGMSAGLGLGLAIVKRLAALLDHRIAIESLAGRGTVVRLFLPGVPPREHPVPSIRTAGDSLRGVRVLVIEDEAPIREAMQGLLLRWNCEVSTAADGAEALQQARLRQPDVILCDLDLAHGESGLDVAETIRRECGSEVHCAFVTGESSPALIDRARTTGHPVLFKPATPGKLRALLEHLARSGRAQARPVLH